jgi:ubiquinone/menaquinone biosynthesis C-methylase UbiE
MKKKLKSFLKRWPKFYNFLKRGYFAFSGMRRRLVGTKLEEKYWAKRHFRQGDDWGNKENDWVRGYWDSRDHSHRSFLMKRIFKLSPSSILEIGCNCGPNLYIFAKKFPDAEIRGIDVNPMAVQKGNEWFTEEGISNVKLLVGKADDLRQFKDKSFDVVFTDAVLIYIGPDKIKKVIEEMLRVTRKALIFLEWHCFDSRCNPLGVYVGHWMRDYIALLREFVPESKIKVTKLPKALWPDQNWQRWGGVIEVVM